MSPDIQDNRPWWQRRKWRIWFSGIAQGVIHGAVTSGGAVLTLSAAKTVGVDVPQLSFRQFAIIMAWGSVSGGIAYLRQSPWPKDEDDTEHLTPGPPPAP